MSQADGILEDMSARMRSPVLVGRAEHLSTLDASLDRSRAGGPSTMLGPSTVFIDGEVGIGKSRLVDEFAAGVAEAGPAVLIIEDAHWADRSTRHLMAFLIGSQRVLVGVLRLPGDPGGSHEQA
jgi:predicted ATPase